MNTKIGLVATLLILSGCGYSARDNEAVGQVKRVINQTPMLCPDMSSVDFSLGVMRNGTGSVSKEDLWFYIPSDNIREQLKAFAESGKPVKITYDVKRFTFCIEDHIVRKVEAAE